MTDDYRDQVIETLADYEAAALEKVQELEHENRILREMISEALTQLASQTAHLEAARHAISALRWESRARNSTRAAA